MRGVWMFQLFCRLALQQMQAFCDWKEMGVHWKMLLAPILCVCVNCAALGGKQYESDCFFPLH